MKLMPFERQFILEASPCPRCGGTGAFAHACRQHPRDCWNCRGLGRKPTHEALEVFYEVCEFLGCPLPPTMREGRLEPRHLNSVMSKQLVPGMRIRPAAPTMRFSGAVTWPREVQAVEVKELQLLVHLDDGRSVLVDDHTVFSRELTEEEISQVETLMAAHVGNGVIDAAAASARENELLYGNPHAPEPKGILRADEVSET